MEKSHIKIVKFEAENLLQIQELIKNSLHLSCNLQIIGANVYSNLVYTPFSCKKLWSWIGGLMHGWVDGRASLRIA